MLFNMTSGDQFRASGGSWPSAAHHQTIFYNPTFGPYPLFHDPGNPTGLYPASGSLYQPSGPVFGAPNLSGPGPDLAQANSLQHFMENSRVMRPYFAPKLQFGVEVPPILPNVPNPYMDAGLSHLELMTKNLLGSRTPFASSDKKMIDEDGSRGSNAVTNELQSPKGMADFVFIKSELGEVNNRGCEAGKRGGGGGGGSGRNGEGSSGSNQRSMRTSHTLSDADCSVGSQNVIMQDVNQPELRGRRMDGPESQSEKWDSKYSLKPGIPGTWDANEKCNINVIDLSINSSQRKDRNNDVQVPVKRESISDMYRLSVDQCANPQNLAGPRLDYSTKESTASLPQPPPPPPLPLALPPTLPSTSSSSSASTFAADVPSHTSTLVPKNVVQRRCNLSSHTSANPDIPPIPIKNELTNFHKCVPLSSTPSYITANPLALGDMFHPASRLNLLDKCSGSCAPSEGERAVSRPLDHNFLNTRLNPCYFTGNLSLDSQFTSSNFSASRWSDTSFMNPFQMGSMTSSSSTLMDPSPFDFSNPLGVKQEAPSAIATAPTLAASAPETAEPPYICARPPPNSSNDNVDFRLPPVGFEILRDPVTGKFLLIPAASIEALQRALFWPGYQPPELLPISNNELVKGSIGTPIKEEEDCSAKVTSSQTPREEEAETRTNATRNWLVEKVPKTEKEEETSQPVDISGLELLSRGIETRQREADAHGPKMDGLGMLCALAEQRMKDEIEDNDNNNNNNNEDDEDEEEEEDDEDEEVEVQVVEDEETASGKPKKILSRRKELNLSPKKEEGMEWERSPPVLEKETDFPAGDSMESEKVEETKAEPPTLTPNAAVPDDEEEEVDVEDVEEEEDKKPVVVTEIREEEEEDAEEGVEREEEEEEETATKRKLLPLRHIATRSKKRRTGRKRSQDSLQPVPKSKSWPKADSVTCSCAPERLESFEIVHSEGPQSSKEVAESREGKLALRSKSKSEPVDPPGTPSEEEESDDKEEELLTRSRKREKLRRKGKLILKLRREKIRLTSDGDDDSAEEAKTKSCILSTDSLMSDKFPIRILTVDGGLFYTGQLSAIQPPDVYGITIDGERGNRPHIYSREEILNNSILEVKPTSTDELKPGTRVCAYWSGQYRCLYPGSVSAASPSSTSTSTADADKNSVNVEFDDGDSCRIGINDIRLLPENYPIVEYDPNPLQSLAKKKRRVNIKSDDSHEREQDRVREVISEVSAGPSGRVVVKKEPVDVAIKVEPDTEMEDAEEPVVVSDYMSDRSERRLRKKMKREKKRLLLDSLSEAGQKSRKKHKKHRHKHGKKRKSDRGESMDTTQSGEGPGTSSSRGAEEGECSRSTSGRRKRKRTKTKESSEASGESSSDPTAIAPRKPWCWSGKGFRRAGVKGKARKEYYRAIQRGDEKITIGECAVFLSTGRPDRPFIGRIESMWETWGANMVVRVKWFYHPEETVGCPATLEYPGALFESPHSDENDVQTISHKCEVLPLKRYIERLGKGAKNHSGSTTLFYLAGFYDPTNTSLQFQEGVK